jgi:hypothetical protein
MHRLKRDCEVRSMDDRVIASPTHQRNLFFALLGENHPLNFNILLLTEDISISGYSGKNEATEERTLMKVGG